VTGGVGTDDDLLKAFAVHNGSAVYANPAPANYTFTGQLKYLSVENLNTVGVRF
jgi:hypothetical protein